MSYTRLLLANALLLAAASLGFAQTQVQPGRDINWPPSCTSAALVYIPFNNTCTGIGLVPLSGITGATTSPAPVNHGNHIIEWDWDLIGGGIENAFTFGEGVASHNDPASTLVTIQTLPGSTIWPLQVLADGTRGFGVDHSGNVTILGSGPKFVGPLQGSATGPVNSPSVSVCNLTAGSVCDTTQGSVKLTPGDPTHIGTATFYDQAGLAKWSVGGDLSSAATLTFQNGLGTVFQLTPNGIGQTPGEQHFRFASCTTPAAANGQCNATHTLSPTFFDANYTLVCSPIISGATTPVELFVKTPAPSSFTYYLQNAPGNTSASSAIINCIAFHD